MSIVEVLMEELFKLGVRLEADYGEECVEGEKETKYIISTPIGSESKDTTRFCRFVEGERGKCYFSSLNPSGYEVCRIPFTDFTLNAGGIKLFQGEGKSKREIGRVLFIQDDDDRR